MRNKMWPVAALSCLGIVVTDGCKERDLKKTSQGPSDIVATKIARQGPSDSPVQPTMDQGWCGPHGVPESVCTRCNSSLIPTFKQAGDWCAEHALPETQCTACNPSVETEWARLKPAQRLRAAPPDSEVGLGPATSPVPPTMDEGWCGPHGVPESVCSRCNDSLIPVFQQAGDWCANHGLPESQCTSCHPEVAARWARLDPSRGPQDIRIGAAADQSRHGVYAPDDNLLNAGRERPARLLTGSNAPLCQVESLRVRFSDSTILDKAGIDVERAKRRPMSASVEVSAESEFDATRVTRITPRVSGVLIDVPATVGTWVDVGEVLAVLDSPALGEAKSQYIVLAQNLRLAQADLDRINTIFSGVHRMLDVCTPQADPEKVRETLAESPMGEAKARLLRAHATLLLAQSEADREATLLRNNLNSERDHQAARSALAAAEANFVAIREEIAFNAERDRLLADKAVKVARGALEAAMRRLRIMGLSETQIDSIGSESHERLSRFVLRSVAEGYIIERTVAVGESASPDDVLFIVADNTRMWVIADLYERDIALVREGMTVLFTVDGMPGIRFDGRVAWISQRVDPRSRTVRVRADFPNPDGLLKSNQFGRARIILHDNNEVLTVPNKSIQTDGCCQLAFVRESETAFRPQKVSIGASAGGFVEILAGLKDGDEVATTGSFLLKTEILKGNIGAGCCEVHPGR